MTTTIDPAAPALFLDGEARPADHRDVLQVLDKSTGAPLGTAAVATREDVAAAVAGAHRAQPGWAATPGPERAAILRRAAALLQSAAEEFTVAVMRESGASRADAAGEVAASVIELFQAADLATAELGEIIPSARPGRVNLVERRPVGVVGLITAWNAPLHIALRVLAPALGLGNAVVLKPAPPTPLVGGLMIADLLAEAGIPAGLVQVLPGDPAGPALVDHPDVNMIHFTGSGRTGRRVYEAAAAGLKRVALELGGNNATVVLADADLAEAARAGAAASFGRQGQVCIATGRHIVLRQVAEEYTALLAEQARALRVGDPMSGEVDLGPMISADEVARALGLVERSAAAGARLVTGGEADGPFLTPAVVDRVRPGMPLHDEEVFAPIAPVIVADDENTALEIVNATPYGLSASVFSRDLDRAWAFADRVHAGMVHVNDASALHEPHVPFGGVGESGVGERFGGRASIDLLTERRWTSLQRSAVVR
ncbi:aldehyde dehydrogenase family protein [Thermopolyspora sp. NPDC052614]|uniref:aldehyde dehydrogenase family protein n=1 Tax=Thermopolyspora sp. NPDC052614 TaxID=3155682 RepID=UPI0034217C5D